MYKEGTGTLCELHEVFFLKEKAEVDTIALHTNMLWGQVCSLLYLVHVPNLLFLQYSLRHCYCTQWLDQYFLILSKQISTQWAIVPLALLFSLF